MKEWGCSHWACAGTGGTGSEGVRELRHCAGRASSHCSTALAALSHRVSCAQTGLSAALKCQLCRAVCRGLVHVQQWHAGALMPAAHCLLGTP